MLETFGSLNGLNQGILHQNIKIIEVCATFQTHFGISLTWVIILCFISATATSKYYIYWAKYMSVLLMHNFLAKVMYDNIIFIRKKLIVQLPNFQTLLSKWIWLQFSKWANLVSLSEFTALNFEIKHPHGNTKRTFWNEL